MNTVMMRSCLEAMGYTAEEDHGELRARGSDGVTVHLRSSGDGVWVIAGERRIPLSEVSAVWSIGDSGSDGLGTLSETVKVVASSMPLVTGSTAVDGIEVAITFSAPFLDDGVSRQALALTISAVARTASLFSRVESARADAPKSAAALRDQLQGVLASLDAGEPGQSSDKQDGTGQTLPPAQSVPTTSPVTMETSMPNAMGVAGEFWFYVDTEQSLGSGGPGTQPVARLRPGIWYRALRVEGSWVEAIDDRGVQGWVRMDAIRIG